MEELERHLAAANMDLSFAQQTLSSTNDYDEQVRILASLLTNQPTTSNIGGDVVNGAYDAHAQENISMIANNLASSANQTASFTQQQVTQFYQSQQSIPAPPQYQNVQTSIPQHSGMVVNMTVANTGRGQNQQIGTSQLAPGRGHIQQVNPGHLGMPGRGQMRQIIPVTGGSTGAGHPQQVGAVHQVNQFINSHHGSPVHQISSPVPHGVHSPGSPQTPNSVQNVRVPVPATGVSINSQSTAKMIHQQLLQSIPNNSIYSVRPGISCSSPVGTPPLPPGVQSTVLNQQAHQNLVNQLCKTQQFYPVKNPMEKILNTSLPGTTVTNQSFPSNLIAGVGNQQINQLVGNMLHPKLFQQQAVSGNGQFSVPSTGNKSVPSPIISQALTNHVTGSVQSVTHNASTPYHTNVIPVQQSHEHVTNTSVNAGTKVVPPASTMVTSANSKLTVNSNLEAVPHMYQNGFPNPAQLLSDINSGKITLTGNQATDPQLLQTLAQSLTPQHHTPSKPGLNNQRIAQTGTGS